MHLILLLSALIASVVNESNGIQYGTQSFDSFADKEFEAIAEDASGNFIYSPISLVTSLAMAYWGAAGNTRQQLDSVNQNPYEYVPPRDLSSEDEADESEGIQFSLANKMFLAENFTTNPSFDYVLTNFFGSETQNVNFAKATEASKTINDWVAAETNNRIQDLIQPADLNSGTALVIANAVYFKGNWVKAFDEEETTMLPFFVNGTTEKKVPTMWKVDSFFYGELPEVKAKFIELPYKKSATSDPMSMFIVLPDEVDGIAELVKNFHKVTIKKLHEAEKWDVEVLLPKFKIETTLDLEPSLVKLGLTDLFGSSADFSGISDDQSLTISKIIQKSYIAVNEQGTEAASATGWQLETKIQVEPEANFTVNRPFVSVVATEYGVPIFISVTMDPTAGA